MADCPELDTDDLCGDCRFKQQLSEHFDVIELLIIEAIETKPLREHPHRAANDLLHAALHELDDLWDELTGEY